VDTLRDLLPATATPALTTHDTRTHQQQMVISITTERSTTTTATQRT
jgi:hypothetical protein